jgi:hypothetical protein
MHHFWNAVSTPWALNGEVAFSAGGDGGSGLLEQKQRPLGTPAYGGCLYS